MILKPITSEKAVKLVDIENTLIFKTEKNARKKGIKKEFEDIFQVKVESVRTLIRKNHKIAYIKLAKENPAIDVATRLGMI